MTEFRSLTPYSYISCFQILLLETARNEHLSKWILRSYQFPEAGIKSWIKGMHMLKDKIYQMTPHTHTVDLLNVQKFSLFPPTRAWLPFVFLNKTQGGGSYIEEESSFWGKHKFPLVSLISLRQRHLQVSTGQSMLFLETCFSWRNLKILTGGQSSK